MLAVARLHRHLFVELSVPTLTLPASQPTMYVAATWHPLTALPTRLHLQLRISLVASHSLHVMHCTVTTAGHAKRKHAPRECMCDASGWSLIIEHDKSAALNHFYLCQHSKCEEMPKMRYNCVGAAYKLELLGSTKRQPQLTTPRNIRRVHLYYCSLI
jgi:hypothetical protein